MFKVWPVIFVYILKISSLYAQKAELKVLVTTSDGVTPVIFAVIKDIQSEEFALTDAEGEFDLSSFSCQSCKLNISSLGYETLELVLDKGNITRPVLVRLEESVLNLGAIVIEGKSLTRGHLDAWKIPGSSHFLSTAELRKQQYTDPGRLLQNIPGVNVQEEDGYGLRPNIGIRGSGGERSSKITLMEDGVLIAPAPYAEPAAYYFPLFGRVQGLEVLKGSSQIKYGPFTTAGAINLLSTAIPQELSGKLSIRGGSFGGREAHAYAGSKMGVFSILAETFQLASDGFKLLDGGGLTGFNLQDYVIKARVETPSQYTGPYQMLEFKWQQSHELAHETYLGLTATDFELNPYRRYLGSQQDEINTKHQGVLATHFIRIAPQIELTTIAYRNNFNRNWYKLDAVTAQGQKLSIHSGLEQDISDSPFYQVITGNYSGDHTLWIKANNRSYLGQGVQSSLSVDIPIQGFGKHHVDAGVRYHQDEADRFQWQDEYQAVGDKVVLEKAGIAGSESNRINKASAWSGFVQYLWEVGRWTITPGVRYENIRMLREDFGKADAQRTGSALTTIHNASSFFIPGMGLSYQVQPGWALFGGLHRGFSPPGINEGSMPELSINAEAGLRYFKNRLGIKSVLFLDNYTNLLGKDLTATGGQGTGDVYNGGEAFSRGAEIEFKYHFQLNATRQLLVPISLSYSYIETRFKHSFGSEFEAWGQVNADDWLPYVAPHRLYTQVGLESPKWKIETVINYQAMMRSVAGQGPIPTTQLIPARTIVDFSLRYDINEQISIFGQINNALNTPYLVSRHPAGLRPGLPRTTRVGVDIYF